MTPESVPAGSGTGLSPLADTPVDVEVVESERVFEGHVWNIRRDRFVFGDETITREYMDHTGAVAVLALDEEDRVLLIKQYRHPIRRRDWEIPAGLLDVAGEDPLEAAQRELAEEADIEASEWNVLAEFYTTPGGSDEAIRVYLARGIRPTASPHAREAEEADMETRWVSLDECVDAVLDRRIQNPSLVVAVLAARIARDRGWTSLAPADEPWPAHPTLGQRRE